MSYTPIDGPGYEIGGADEGLPPTAAQQLMRARQPLPHNPKHPHSPWDRDDLLVETVPTMPLAEPYPIVALDGEWVDFEPWQGLKP